MGEIVGPEQIVGEVFKAVSSSNRKDDRFRKFNLTSVAKNFLVCPDVIRVDGLQFTE